MKKNGFIATSLIYSFFLIFITLFLSVIADYLQDKVLLNEIEKGIKSDINDTMGIRDFEVGDMIGITSDCANLSTDLDSIPLYTVVNVLINNSTICGSDNNCLILYGVELRDDYDDTVDKVDYEEILNDIDYGHQNNTYYNKIIYNFDTSNSFSYNLGDYGGGMQFNVYKNDSTNCDSDYIVDSYSTSLNCISEDVESIGWRRERKILKESEGTNNRFNKCVSNEETGMIYIEK